jgi:phosphotransferase system  glucose/maltose/N-acetylglucosamine-specific IIC component
MQTEPAHSDEPVVPPPEGQPSQGHAGESMRERLAELREYFSYYTAARLDSLKSSIRRLVLWVAVLFIALLAVAGLVITAVVLICNGICDALTWLLHSRALGEILTGGLLLVGLFFAAYLGLGLMHQFWHSQTVLKYQARRQRQREQFGRDVSGAAKDNESQS